jgi:hypothetical protein
MTGIMIALLVLVAVAFVAQALHVATKARLEKSTGSRAAMAVAILLALISVASLFR